MRMRLMVAPVALLAAASAGLSLESAAFAQQKTTSGLQAPRPEPPAKERFHVYLLMGEDNMAGRGQLREADRERHDRIFKLDDEGAWVQAADPLHAGKPRVSGVGPGMTFARRMVELDKEIAIGLVPCAAAGSSLERWEKGGDLYAAALARARAAMKQGTLKGVLWHQGESDARSRGDALTYGPRLERMIGDLRRDLGQPRLPFIAGKLYRFLPANEFLYAKEVNEALERLPQRVGQTACVDASELTHGRRPEHFGTRSARRLGERYFDQVRKLQRSGSRAARR